MAVLGRLTSGTGADGKIAWSWPSDAGVKPADDDPAGDGG
jgi:hypothetical protein